jgi:flagellar assembly factor FliW
MPKIPTKFFGELDCDAGALYSFPSGLPGFETHTSFFFLTIPGAEPLMLLQSALSANLCFVLLPVLVVDRDYDLRLTPDEASELGLPPDRSPAIGRDVLCAAMVCSGDEAAPTVNLMAPVVVNLHTKVGMQVIHGDTGYSHRHSLQLGEAVLSC